MINAGDIVAGRYRVIKHVGRGGMQEVFKAHDEVLGIDVALKTPQPGQATRRFASSARIAAMVNHHDVAKTLDYFEDGAAYLIEEFIEGETLEDKSAKFGFLDPHLAARVLHHLAKGVAASHRAGVIHRDLKPSNVMTARGVNLHNLKITDFGIATLTEEVFDEAAKSGDLTRSTSGTVKGALPFMAPEMMFRKPGENPEFPIDIWSVGAMMFKLLTGEYPFGVYLDAAVNVRNRERKPWPAFMTTNAQFAPLARELQALVDSCLQYEPGDRPKADELVSRCQQLCYLSVDREEGTVSNLIQNGYSGFADGEREGVFFSMESVYGHEQPDPNKNKHVCFSSFPGSPRRRAHPVLVLKT
ncbi:serine/threonine-protein kinase [Cupriavidus pinatubonensis]|uniref:Serine/threonine-protein kinase PknD n=1 Tax=Cupriavidus pinatubonensis TaxID=248026 RepID=A0ABN7YAE0_9BURK|nr:serine/threonine-protein kinase [Cupriavidus pinatubonensis]CAG9170359.1 Serine/threonine-protein kinase PknD [Cupriavidus pinatubonensis]